jgi:protein O-mannosyl-transferase
LSRLALGVIAVAVVASTGHRFGNEFVFDDVAMIVEGDVIHDLSNLPGAWTSRTMFVSAADDGTVDSVDTYRPLTVTTFFVDAAWSGRDPFGYHLTNLLLHLACAWSFFLVTRRLLVGVSEPVCAFAALVFALHPWLVEAHVWINGRSDPLSLLLVLASAWSILGVREARIRTHYGAWFWVFFGFFGALLAKETSVTLLPALCLLPVGSTWPSRTTLARRSGVLVAAGVLYFAIRLHVLDGARVGSGSALVASLRALPVLWADSFVQALAPHELCLRSMRDEYSLGFASVLGAVGVCLLVGAFAWWMRKRPVVIVALGWFAGPLVPVALIATVLWPGFGRYLYLAIPGTSWLLALLLQRGLETQWRSLAVALAGVYLAVLGVATFSFTRDFESDTSLYSDAISTHPESPMGYGWLGLSLVKSGNHVEAIPFLEQAVLLDPGTHRYLARLGQSLHAVGRFDDSAAIAARGIEAFHGRPEEASYRMLAVTSMTQPMPRAAATHLVRCLEVWPQRRDCLEGIRAVSHDPGHEEALRHQAATASSRVRAEVLSALATR